MLGFSLDRVMHMRPKHVHHRKTVRLISADRDATQQHLCMVDRFTPGTAKPPKAPGSRTRGGESPLQKAHPDRLITLNLQ